MQEEDITKDTSVDDQSELQQNRQSVGHKILEVVNSMEDDCQAAMANLVPDVNVIESSAGQIDEMFIKEKGILIDRKARLEEDRGRVQAAVREVMNVLEIQGSQ